MLSSWDDRSASNLPRLPHVLRQRKAIVKQAFTPYRKLSGPPINIVQFQGDHFSRPKAEACEERESA